MNSDFSIEYAELFAERVQQIVGSDLKLQIQQAWILALGSEPTKKQVEESVDFVNQQQETFEEHRLQGEKRSPELMALASFCQALISSNGFLYVD